MAADWFRSTVGRLFGRSPSGSGQQGRPPGPTPRDQWRIEGIYFDTSGWSLETASAEAMTWSAGQATLALTRGPRDPPTSSHLDSLRRQCRARVRAEGADIVSVTGVPRRGENEDLVIITKRRAGLGFAFSGIRTIRHASHEYTVRVEAEEQLTGIREAMLTGQLAQVGALEFGEADAMTGSRRILNFVADPYDPEFDEQALHCASDDERLDPLFPDHPLTRIRATLQRVDSTLELDGTPAPREPGQDVERVHDVVRPALPPAALRELYWQTGRNDLLAAHLMESLAVADPDGSSRDPEVGRMNIMLGHARHNSGNVVTAAASFRRARDIFNALPEHRREAGIAMAALGRSQKRLDLLPEAEQSFSSAVAALDEAGDESMHLTFALSWLVELLALLNRVDEATPLAQRLARIVEERPLKEGLASLHELTGGAPPELVARIRHVKPK